MPLMQDFFGASPSQMQLSLSLFVFAMGLGQLIVGPLADKLGRRPIAIAGILLFLLGSVAISVSNQLLELLVWRVIQGLGASCTSVVAITVVRDSFSPRDSARIYSYLNGALNIIPALAPVLGGVLLSIYGWRSSFVCLAVFSLLVFAVTFKWLPETRPATTHAQLGGLLQRYAAIVKNRQFALYALCALGAMSVVLNYAFMSPQILMVELGLSSVQFALLFALNALLIMAGSAVAPTLLNRYGRRHCIVYGSLTMLLAGILMALFYGLQGYSVVGFMLPVGLACSGFTVVLGASASLALEPFGDSAGTASALQGCIQMLGAALSNMALALLPVTQIVALAALMIVFGLFGIASRRIGGATLKNYC